MCCFSHILMIQVVYWIRKYECKTFSGKTGKPDYMFSIPEKYKGFDAEDR